MKQGYALSALDRLALSRILLTFQSVFIAGAKWAGLFLFYLFSAGFLTAATLRRKAAFLLTAVAGTFFLFTISGPPAALSGKLQWVNPLIVLLLFFAALFSRFTHPGTHPVTLVKECFSLPTLRGLLTFLFLVLFLLACFTPGRYFQKTRITRGASVLLISIDTLRADHLGCYGHPGDTSPCMDALAARAALFRQCLVQDHWTLPSHMSMMTSLYPDRHQVYPGTSLPDAIPTLAQLMYNAGYNTQAFVSGIHWMSPDFGFSRGFLDYDFPPSIVNAEEISRKALGWLEKNHDAPFFLFLHFYDPHADSDIPPYYSPYPGGEEDPDEEIFLPFVDLNRRESIVEFYNRGIRYVDHFIGEILRKTEDLDIRDLMIILTSDHGEEFFDHGMIGHLQAYEEIARVPLIVYLPDTDRHRTLDTLVQGIDISPTILDYLNLPVPALFQGRSFLPLLLGKDRGAFEEPVTYIKGNWKYVIRTPRWKLFWNKGEDEAMLYHIEKDPLETVDVAENFPDVAAALKKDLQAFLKNDARPLSGIRQKKKSPSSMDEKEREKLKKLGYLW